MYFCGLLSMLLVNRTLFVGLCEDVELKSEKFNRRGLTLCPVKVGSCRALLT